MSRKTSAVAGGDTGLTSQYNFVRDEATASSWLLAYGDTSTNTLKVLVNAGVAYFGGTKVEFAGGYSPAMTAPTASSRIDVVSISSTPEIVITVGTEADSPTAPTPPTSDIPICEVYHKAGEVKITDETDGSNGYIYKDLRDFLIRGAISNFSTPSRAFDTVYQNTTGKWKMVTVLGTVGGTSFTGGADLKAYIGATSSPASLIGQIIWQMAGSLYYSSSGNMTFLVPPNWYYTVTWTKGSQGTSILDAWWEGELSY